MKKDTPIQARSNTWTKRILASRSSKDRSSKRSWRIRAAIPPKRSAAPVNPEIIGGSLSMLFPGHHPAQEQAGDEGAADGIVWFYVNELVRGMDLVHELFFKFAILLPG